MKHGEWLPLLYIGFWLATLIYSCANNIYSADPGAPLEAAHGK